MSNVCIIAWVYGRVQGVGFRYSTQHEAQRLGLTGYAKNMDDGSVEVVACGDAAQVEKLIKWLKEGGPRSARVDKILTEPHSPRETANRLQYSVLNTLYRFGQTGDFGRLLCRAFREQTIQITAVAFFFAELIRHRFYQHSDGGRGIKLQVKFAHEAHDFPVFRRELNAFIGGDSDCQRFTPLRRLFQIAFAISTDFFTFKDQHNVSLRNQHGRQCSKK